MSIVSDHRRPRVKGARGRADRGNAPAAAFIEPLEPRQFLSAASPPGLDPRVYAPHATVRGETMQEWSADWFKWAFSIPASTNPILDATGAQAGQGDVGKVFFLAGVGFGGPLTVTRQLSLPSGTPVLVPIINSIADESEPDAVGPDTFSVDFLRQLAAGYIGAGPNPFDPSPNQSFSNVMSATLDGKAITGLSDHREISPVYSYTVPATDNLWQAIGLDVTHTTPPAVSDGYWLMLQPLQPGHHVLHITGTANTPYGFSFSGDMTFDITVLPQGQYNHQQASTIPPAAASPAAEVGGIHKKLLKDLLGST